MRFLFYTDLHLALQIPRHRIDEWSVTLLEKLAEVYETAESLDCDFLVFGGDFFNTHRIYSYDIISTAMDIICSSKLKTYGIIGQHDLYGYNPETFKTSAYAFMINRCSNFKIIWKPTKIGNVTLYASHVWDELSNAKELKPDKDSMNVLVAHHLLTSDRKPFEIDDTNSFAKNCNFDLVLSGDLHCGFQTHEVNDTLFCNPGALARRNSNEVSRMPQVAIIDCEGALPVVSIKRLKCGKSGEEVFSESLIETVRKAVDAGVEVIDEEKIKANKFVDKLAAFEKESGDIHELIQKAGVELGVRQDVLSYLSTKKAKNFEKNGTEG